MVSAGAVLLGLGGLAVLLGMIWLRQQRISCLLGQLHQPLAPHKPRISPNQGTTGSSTMVADALALSGLSAVEVLWQWATIDPQVIAAVDFAHVDEVRNGFELAQWVHDRITPLEGVALQGMHNRLLGYLGEQRVSALLMEQGQRVETAETATQPIWDLLIDDQQANVKTVLDLHDIRQVALSHPEVLYLVPEDAQGPMTDNMQVVDGFRHDECNEALNHALSQADGSAAEAALGQHVPIFGLMRSLHQNHQAMQQGRTWEVAAQHVTYDTLSKGLITPLAVSVCSKIGLLFGPMGLVAGTVVGGLIGTVLAGDVAKYLKNRKLVRLQRQLGQLLQQLGARHAGALPYVLKLLSAPVQRQLKALQQLQRPSLWRRIWPSRASLLAQAVYDCGQRQLQVWQEHANRLTDHLHQQQSQQQYHLLAMLLLNVPELREDLGVDVMTVRRILQQQQHVFAERIQLDPTLSASFERGAQGLRLRDSGLKPSSTAIAAA